jgi:hypothetical protein
LKASPKPQERETLKEIVNVESKKEDTKEEKVVEKPRPQSIAVTPSKCTPTLKYNIHKDVNILYTSTHLFISLDMFINNKLVQITKTLTKWKMWRAMIIMQLLPK